MKYTFINATAMVANHDSITIEADNCELKDGYFILENSAMINEKGETLDKRIKQFLIRADKVDVVSVEENQ